MRPLVATMLLFLSTGVVFAQATTVSVPDMTAPAHSITFPPSVGATLKPGTLVDMSRPPFLTKEPMRLECEAGEIVPISQTTVAVVTRADRSSIGRQVALAVEGSMSPIGSGRLSISNEELDEIRQNSIYARITVIDGVQTLNDLPKWPADWTVAHAASDEDTITRFARDYGTHYINTLKYGWSISIKAILGEMNQNRTDELEAKLRAQFLIFSLDAAYVEKAKQELSGYKFDLLISVQGGKADKPEQMLLRSFDELNSFIDKLRDGKFKIESVPVSADLLSLAGRTGNEGVDRMLWGEIKLAPTGFGRPISVAPQAANIPGLFSGNATTDGFVIVTTGGYGSVNELDILVDGELRTRVFPAKYAGTVCPVAAGEAWNVKAAVDAKNGNYNVKTTDITVKWMPLGVSPRPK